MADAKPKVAFYWCASCGGCEEAVVDLAEKVIDVAAAVDIVFWPVALDFKRKDVEALPDGAIAATFLNGAIRTTEHEEMAHLLRRKSQVLVAFGACAATGGVPGLANLWDRDTICMRSTATHPALRTRPECCPNVTTDRTAMRSSSRVSTTRCDRSTRSSRWTTRFPAVRRPRNCLPTPSRRSLAGTLPAKGSVLAPDVALCDSCHRQSSKPDQLSIPAFKRPHQVLIDEEQCLLAQGLVCMGPGTRSGCGSRCISGNMPCTGCFGPTSRVRDGGAKAFSGIVSLLEAKDDEAIERALEGIPDPIGTFYRYTLPASRLRRRRIDTVS